QLIEADEGEGKTKMTLVMVHAQDHLMTSILAKELVTELIDIYRTRPQQA
ncbi:PTS lactose/cellobiose transporter subunit IIA, partial [Escherichia sp. TWPC-MK]